MIEEIEDDKTYSVEQFELGENGEERFEKEENVPLADLLPETTETSDFLEGGPQKWQIKLTEKGKAYEIEKLRQKRQNTYAALSKQIKKIRQSLDDNTQDSYHWFDIRDRECFEIRAKLVERINALEQTKFKSPNGSVKSGHSRGTKSSLSSSLGLSIRLGAAAKIARLRAEMTFFDRDSEM